MAASAFNVSGNWYKGNLHTHTTISDGTLAPADLVKLYRDMKYDFLAITDHRIYGIHEDLSSRELLLLPGVELDVRAPDDEAFCHHIVGLGLPGANRFEHGHQFQYPADMTVHEIIQELREGGNLCIYAHPAWSHVRHEVLDALDGLFGLEIYNHGCEVESLCGYSDNWYDRQLWQKRNLFCLATDDSHQRALAKPGSDTSPDFGGGFVRVKAPELTAEAIHDALAAGYFYASQGPEINDFRIEGDEIVIESSPCRTIGFQTDSYWGAAKNDFTSAALTQARFKLRGRESYVRAICIDQNGRHAWSQPIWLDR